ncbi:MAG: sigma-54-dependent transcriptional regulator, partial [Psychrobacter sp.]
LKLGAFDFVNKPLELPRLRQLVENALKVAHQSDETKATPEHSPEQKMLDSRLIGNSAIMQPLKKTILKLARSQAPVFLSGASGTGKEVVAKLIHDLSPRRDGSFVPVNCGAIPSELMESEFFGHKKGSFTGAVTDKQGLFQQANGGTLFLDEVADLPLVMQVKLLRAIQEKTVRAIGDTKEVPVDIRILSATHKDLNQLVQSGTFRQDLYYRINVIELQLPTLNERREDIPVLAMHFLAMIAEEWQLDTPLSLTKAACNQLKSHDFAGNVRELRNVLERAVTLAETSDIDISHLGLPDCVPSDDNTNRDNTANRVADPTNTPISHQPLANDAFVHNQMHIQSMDSQVTFQAKASVANSHSYRTNIQHHPSTIQSTADNQAVAESTVQRNTESATIRHGSRTTNDDKLNLREENGRQLPLQGLEHYLQEQEKQMIITAL